MNAASLLLATEGVGAVTMDSALSIALVLALVGATATISSKLAAAIVKLDALQGVPDRLTRVEGHLEGLKNVPERLLRVEGHVENLENDVNNLWSAVRADSPDIVRRERGPFRSSQRKDKE